jgi:hypothetical protein
LKCEVRVSGKNPKDQGFGALKGIKSKRTQKKKHN